MNCGLEDNRSSIGVRERRLRRRRSESSVRTQNSRLWRSAVSSALFSVLALKASAFVVTSSYHRSNAALPASRKSLVVEPVAPKTSTSKKRRAEAVDALDRMNLKSMDHENMLEFIAEQYLYKNGDHERIRPKGRPECVPGAMTHETMARFRERQDVFDYAINEASDAELEAIAELSNQRILRSSAPVPKVKGRSKANSRGNTLPTSSSPKRKPVVKNLVSNPKTEKDNDEYVSRAGKNSNKMDLQKYYHTPLLSQDEEYSLGMKIQTMMMCEEVHEGLSIDLMRLPTFEEWAGACGFTEDDPYFVATEADEELRPSGSDSMFEEIDPCLFVGNGQLGDAGPGRGRGRTKDPPPKKLPDIYDDSELRARGERVDKSKLEPINRGTPTDFVEMMMTARDAKQRMVQSNMRLVVSIARKYANVGVSLQDLVQEGSLGLSRAAEKFEPRKGFKFSTYASWWIQQAVFRSIAYHSRTIRLPVHVHNLLNRMRKVRSEMQKDFGRYPTAEEMAAELGMSVEKYNKIVRLTKRAISLEAPKYKSNPKDLGHESEDMIKDTVATHKVLDDEVTPETSVDRNLFIDDLKDMLEILNDDEKKVIYARYGLTDGFTRTVTQVAAQMHQSKAWVRSQECRALRKLRRPWYEKKLKEHQDALSN